MEGGLSRKRGYVVLVALLAVALLALYLWRGCHYEVPSSETVAIDTTLLSQLDAASGQAPRSLRDNGPNRGHREQPRYAHAYDHDSRSFPKTEGAPAGRRSVSIDLNTADTAELQLLWGIGPVLSARIVRYRNLLGGFTDKEQLREVYGLADSVYERIAPQLTVDTSCIQQLDVNTATFGQLLRHPYLDKHQVAAIIRLREKQGPYQSLDDLHQIPIIEQETYNKITPYLSCNSQPKK